MRQQTPIRTSRFVTPLMAAAVLFLLFVYWLVAREIEGVDYIRRMPLGWRDLLRNYPLFDTFTPIVAFVLELMTLSVLRHFIPIAAGFVLAYYVVLDLMQHLYELPDNSSAARIFSRLRGNISKPVVLNRQTFEQDRLDNPELRIGGPGAISIYESDVVVTEINGRFERVLGKGKHRLKRFEYVYAILDLTSQETEERNVRLTTKDGIDVLTNVVVNFRIQRNNPRPNLVHKFTYDSDSVRKAAYANTVIGGAASGWQGIPLAIAVGQLRDEIAKRTLDELIDPSRDLDIAPHPNVQTQVRGRTRQILRQFGLELTSVKLGGIVTDQQIQDKLVEYWRASAGRAGLADHVPQDPERLRRAKENRIREQIIQNLSKGLRHMQDQGASMYRQPSSSPTRDLERLLPYLTDLTDMIRSNSARSLLDPQPPQENKVITPKDDLNDIVRHLIEQFGGGTENSADNQA